MLSTRALSKKALVTRISVLELQLQLKVLVKGTVPLTAFKDKGCEGSFHLQLRLARSQREQLQLLCSSVALPPLLLKCYVIPVTINIYKLAKSHRSFKCFVDADRFSAWFFSFSIYSDSVKTRSKNAGNT